MAIQLWKPRFTDPFRELRQMEREMGRLFEDYPSFSSSWPTSWLRPSETTSEIAFTPACDMEETENHFLFSFDLPGVNKDEIKIEVIGNQLIVNGERKKESKEEKKGYYRAEREYGQFQRSFTLPTEVSADKVEANFQDGVLRIAIPKSEAAKAKTRQVRIGEAKSGWWDKLLGHEKVKEVPSKSAA